MSRYTCVLFCLIFVAPLARAQSSRAVSAVSYLQRGNDWIAKGELDRAIGLDPQNARFYSNRGGAWLRRGLPERALSDLNQALVLDQKLSEAWYQRGVAWFAKQDYTQAIADFDEALRLNPRLAEAFCSRGVARMAQGKPAESEVDIRRCQSLGGSLKPEAGRLLEETRRHLAPDTVRQ